MIYPSIADLSDKGVNRYMLSIATAKCARRITDEQLAKNQVQESRDDKFSSYSSAKKALANEKPVKEAIEKLYTREYKIVVNEEK
ncbi:MAG: DNA-directed RNA polymerase subunit omega [Clostridia bacterium]|nr:DNA-directed RNA polymerase subunit omega [Clostridia bacterium]